MRQGLMWLAVLAALTPLTCGPRTHFDVQQTGEAIVAGSPNSLTFTGFDPFTVANNPVISEQGLQPKQYQSIKMATLSLRTVSAGDLSFIKKISFYAEATGQPRALIASAGPFAVQQAIAFLTIPHAVELVNYFKATRMRITTDVALTAPAQAVTLEAAPTFTFTVNELPAACLNP